MLEVPAGGSTGRGRETRPNGSWARRRRAGRLERLGGFYVSPGFTNEFVHVFLATELEPSPLRPEADEQLAVVSISFAEALRLVGAGEIRDAKSIIG
jgi:ADP-ribose pyrophosphatase